MKKPSIIFVVVCAVANVHDPSHPIRSFHFFWYVNGFLRLVGMTDLQVDMRDFINAPNGLSKQSLAANERVDTDPSQSPLGGKTV